MRLAETQRLTVEQLITQLNQEKESISSELSILSARINRLRDTGTEEGIIRSVETAMKDKAQQYEKLEEELKLLRVRAFSMATPREDTRRRRPVGEQPTVPEN
jgi:DNA-binding transcriptional regulator LsrR (DeoR family)